ncbi:Probable multidrug-efflux transporter Rv1258c/MT1297 [Corynebacterium kutscheri]|uniref:Arabinose efflux permease family protein n=1 Tax=Corynebacterium kutscheri TaxID=35755 RepID=A0A0F6TCP7_9CORY|nr:MFS transporter [Corynebacterium kutscheri]AKE41016.1 arabinose efflux permease family protein [Corynebacterium kutscheri]VEH06906.1 Probable multidrug-efflux transporter Rv1258c/MT1297 [Corynebacterium kutscheri]VEH09314.1 Probable multidrug-efflux transporter Rv1258c/MT1297 [Corynebacterium kutscheri]VEH79402.1 Probable multidrug-efflux transporter Rv1258c/MT1297 [Corynebacterium kutscheri]
MRNPILYLASAGASMFGNAVVSVVWPWLVLAVTGDPKAAGIVATFTTVPSVLFAFVGGQLIDSFGRKPMSIIFDFFSAASVVALIMVDQYGDLTVAWFIVLGILGAIGDIPGMAARNALVNDVAQSQNVFSLERISGLLGAITGISFLIGPAVGGILLGYFPTHVVLWFTAGSSFLAAVLTIFVRLPASEYAAEKIELRGWLEVLKEPEIRLLAVVSAVGQIVVPALLIILLPAHYEAINTPRSYGLVFSMYSVGMIAASGVISIIGLKNRRRLWVLIMLGDSIGLLLFSYFQSNVAIFGGAFIAGIAGGLMAPLQTVWISELVPDKVRGRAFSVFMMIGEFAAPIGFAFVTIALGFMNIYSIALAIGFIFAAITLVALIVGLRVIHNDSNTKDVDRKITSFATETSSLGD